MLVVARSGVAFPRLLHDRRKVAPLRASDAVMVRGATPTVLGIGPLPWCAHRKSSYRFFGSNGPRGRPLFPNIRRSVGFDHPGPHNSTARSVLIALLNQCFRASAAGMRLACILRLVAAAPSRPRS